MITIVFRGGVSTSILVPVAHPEQICHQRAVKEPYHGNRQKLHFIAHSIQQVQQNVLCNWHQLLKSGKVFIIVWPIQITIATMISHISLTAILSNALSFSCNSLRSGNVCLMLQQRNSMMLRNVSTQR